MEEKPSLPVRVYTPKSSIQDASRLLREMWRDLRESRDLAWRLLVRDITGQYRQSILGILWAFVPPIVLAGGLLLARKANVINFGETALPYALYVMLSMVLWQTFTESLNAPIRSVRAARPLLAKMSFPREAIIVAQAGHVLFNFSIKSLFIAALLIWFGIGVDWRLILAPAAVLSMIAFGFGLGLILAPVANLFTDVSRGLAIVINLWLFATPVVYPVPESGVFSVLVKLNPVTHLLVTTRELITAAPVSDAGSFLATAVFGWTILVLGLVIFRLAMPLVIERLSA